MKDFSLEIYKEYVNAIKSSGLKFITFKEYLSTASKPEKFCLIRHDVDRKAGYALKMAKLEKELGAVATYYFRIKPDSFVKEVIHEIAEMGHEVGYHYECLSDTNGNYEKALIDFDSNLKKFDGLADIKTISMHGRPFKPYDNRDLWRIKENHQLLKNKYGILGELYLDIDYTDIAYINDTGRNWLSNVSNFRDKTNSKVPAEFNNADELLNYLKTSVHPKMVFQIHPERWSSTNFQWLRANAEDTTINLIKSMIKMIRK